MNNIALLGVRLVGLVLMMILSYVAIGLMPAESTGVGGAISVFLPPIVLVAASMYAIHRSLYSGRFSRTGAVLFHALNLMASLLLTAVGVFIAFGVQIALFGE